MSAPTTENSRSRSWQLQMNRSSATFAFSTYPRRKNVASRLCAVEPFACRKLCLARLAAFMHQFLIPWTQCLALTSQQLCLPLVRLEHCLQLRCQPNELGKVLSRLTFLLQHRPCMLCIVARSRLVHWTNIASNFCIVRVVSASSSHLPPTSPFN